MKARRRILGMQPWKRLVPVWSVTAALLCSGCPQDDDTRDGSADTDTSTSGVPSSDTAGQSQSSAADSTGGQDTATSGQGTSAATTATATGGEESSGGEQGCEALPTFERDIVPILEVSCGTGDVSCHERSAYSATFDMECRGWLALENTPLGAEIYAGPTAGEPTGCPDMPLYERLLELDAWTCEAYDPRAAYVVPCDPESSYLYRKLVGDVCNIDIPSKGQSNVPSLDMPIDPYELSPDAQQLIYTWIENGAPRDGEGCDALCGSADGSSESGSGAAPQVSISHPGEGEMRVVGVPVPMIGQANDAEDGELQGASLTWTSNEEGVLGTGQTFDWTPAVLGEQTITLTAADNDGMEASDSITLTIVPE